MIDDRNHPASCATDPVLTSLQSVAGRGFDFLCVQQCEACVVGQMGDESEPDGGNQ